MKYLHLSLILSLYLAVGLLPLHAQDAPRWLRHPAISPDGATIAFTYKGDLYTVPATGGDATQITFHEAHDYMAVWSADGEQLAFASNRYGNFDVYTMPARGGSATRLTYHSNDEQPYTFDAGDSTILFGGIRQDDADHRQFPHRSQPELYRVPTAGGRVTQVLTVPAEYVQISPDGHTLLYHDKKGGEDEYRKHHTSAIARDIWEYDRRTGTHNQLTDHAAEDRQPIWHPDGESFYFLSERGGTFNVYQRRLPPPSGAGGPEPAISSEQLTNFDLHPVRFLSLGGGTLCFSYDGELYTLRDGGEPQRVAVDIRTQGVGNNDAFLSVAGDINEMAVSPDGEQIAFVARGEVFVTAADQSFTKRLTNTPETERFVSWGPEGKTVVYSSERAGKWSVYQTERVRADAEPFFYAATLLRETPLIENEHDNYLAAYSPDGKRLAWIEERRRLRARDLTTGKDTTLMDETELFHMRDGDKYFRWSPDSRWLLVEWDKLLNNSEVLLLKADGSERHNLTQSGYYDMHPTWTQDGNRMIWLSNRDGLKSYATSGRAQLDVYAMFFTQEAWDEYRLDEEDYKLQKAVAKARGDSTKKDTTIQPLTFDLPRFDERIARLTIHSSNLADAVLSKDGEKLYYLARFEDKLDLWSTELRSKETKMTLKLGAKNGELQWDKEHKNLFLLSDGKISKLDLDKEKQTPVKLAGELSFDQAAERRAIFDHVWLRTQKVFYHPDFHGVDWDSLRIEYEKYLSHIGNSFELTEMLSEMLGELNVSHAGARYRPSGFKNPDATAALGIFMDYGYDSVGILIEEVIAGGPLDRAGFDIRPGTVIRAINGQTIGTGRDQAAYLNRLADDFTLLTLQNPGADTVRTLTVKPITLAEENRLLYRRWVRHNEAEVDSLSGGRLGYVHIPGMSDGPYRDIYQDMLGKYYEREGMIVDTRFNGGGDLVADLAMFFTGVPFITYATEAKVVGGEPTSRYTKPTLALINEAQYSDGHCFAQGYTDLEIGTTVGMPTPGTCSFAGWERLPDGTVWGVVPVSAKNRAGEWMENNQTEPDIKVKNEPEVIAEGRDQQLERAVEVLLAEVE